MHWQKSLSDWEGNTPCTIVAFRQKMAHKTVYSCAHDAHCEKNGWIQLLQNVISAATAKSKIIWSSFSGSLFCLSWHIWLTIVLIWLANLFSYETNQICSLIQTKTLQCGRFKLYIHMYVQWSLTWLEQNATKKSLEQTKINLNKVSSYTLPPPHPPPPPPAPLAVHPSVHNSIPLTYKVQLVICSTY